MKPETSVRVRFGDFSLDVRTGELRSQDQVVLLQEQSLRLLLALIEREGELVTREELQQQLWPHGTLVEFDLGINAAIKRLRRVLGDSPDHPKYIETVGRRGYRLLVPVEWISAHNGDAHKETEERTSRKPEPEHSGLVGQEVSHYRILEILGEGGMGVIYKAQDLRLGRLAALKFLPEEFNADARALSALEHEACLASSLNHPNICSIYELGTHQGQPFIAMELLAGQTLKDLLVLDVPGTAGSTAPLPVDRVLDIAVQVCDGLRAAHEKGIIHRDIKPANLFLTTRGVVKILDFGLAKLIQGDDSGQGENIGEIVQPAGPSALAGAKLTRTGIAIGTAAYMSPEHIRGERLDARTDLFSFGVVLYQMATGVSPFRGETPAELFDAILHQTPVSPSSLNADIPAGLEQVIHRALEKDRNRRYQSAAEMELELRQLAKEISSPQNMVAATGTTVRTTPARRWPFVRWQIAAIVTLIAAWLIVIGGLYWRWRAHKSAALTDKDTIVVADFENKTGDPVFDDTLKQGLAIQLEQSPFLELISQSKVNQTMKLMGRRASDILTSEVARELCQRTGSKAMINGSITNLGTHYVIGLEAVNCNSGDVLAEAQEEASGKERVLNALDKTAISLRSKLGESLASVEEYATPLEEATTPSLEALKAYSQARKAQFTRGDAASVPLYRRAVELDPNFAIAYAMMAGIYRNLNQGGQAAESARKAYALKMLVSEREMLTIDAYYFLLATGELDKAAQSFEVWQQTYPRDSLPYANLGFIYETLGNLEKAIGQYREAMRLQPHDMASYVNLGAAYVNFNLLSQAEAVFKMAEERGLSSEYLLSSRYLVAFLKGDTAKMEQAAQAAMGKPGMEDQMLATQADTEAWHGRFRKASEITRRAMDSALHNDAKETAATYQAAAALREVGAGFSQQARVDADAALKLAPNRDVRDMAALALARAGDTAGAERLAAELDNTFPLDTLIQGYWLPAIRAAVALERKDPNRAIDLLKPTSSVELGQPTQIEVYLIPAYLRGEAYLMLHNGPAAAAEFQKFIDHYGLVENFPWGALARLGLARAYALEAQTDPAAGDKARAAYKDFLTLWKDADPDVPVYKQAKAEYANLSKAAE